MKTTTLLPTKKLLPNPSNPRTITKAKLEKLTQSLRDFPQMIHLRPIVIESLENPMVLGGNMRLQALLKLGVAEVPVLTAEELTAEQRQEFIIKDNVGFGDWDWEALANEWEPLQLQEWGLDIPELPADKIIGEDELPELPTETLTKPGDLWILGRHRLLCGDSTLENSVNYLTKNEKAALILADPPYFNKVDEDWDTDYQGLEGFLKFMEQVFNRWEPLMIDRGTTAWWCAPDWSWHIEGLLRERFTVINHLVWYKGGTRGGKHSPEHLRRWLPISERLIICEKSYGPNQLLSNFTQKTAHIASREAYKNIIDRLIAWKDKANLSSGEIDRCLGTNGMAGHYFGRSQWSLPTEEAWHKLRPLFASRGVDIGDYHAQRSEFDAQRREFDAQRSALDNNITDVWEFPTLAGKERPDHPTPKPVELIGKLVEAHSRRDDLVFDPFLGSGTTLIACEQLGRTCYGLELDPKYCDMIVARWEQLTGEKAVRSLPLNEVNNDKK